jgi:hypothetical protein
MDGGIKFDVSATTAKFEADMGRVANSANTSAGKIKEAFKGLSGILVGGAIAAGLKQLMNDFDRVGKLATRFGTSSESIQRVSVAAEIAGTNIEQVANAMTKAGVAASQAALNGGTMAKTFERAGIDAQQFANAQLDQKVLMVARSFERAGDDAGKTNAIIEILGTRAGANLIPLIQNVQALEKEMANVSVVSDQMVRKIEEANDRMTRFGNDGKVAAASVLQGFINLSERLGSLMADLGDVAKLAAAIPLALTGNVMPLWHVLQTGKTIKEMEEIEARANAINQLTREGAFGFEAEKNAALIAERTEQILAATRDINQQMSISEETLDSSLGLEKEKTAELAKQAEQLAKQEAQRQRAIRDTAAEIALIEAKLTGNKQLEESLREQADFQSAFDKTNSFETAANFAATKSAERAAAEAGQADRSGAPSGGLAQTSPGKSPLQRLEDMSRGGNAAARAALMRAEAEQSRNLANTATLSERGSFGSAARQQIRSEERMQDRAMRELTKQTRDQFFGARNAGDAARNFERDAFKAGMTTKEAMNNMGIDRKLGESTRDALDRFAKDQAKTETERAKEAADTGGGGGGGGGRGASTEPATEATLKQIFEKIQERPILVA